MKKHAYLIMAYNNPQQLLKLIKLLDDARNSIYLHIDKKSCFPMEVLKNATQNAELEILERIPVFWADYSQVAVELKLLRAAVESKKEFCYYHLLSGMDLPLKTQDFIHDFFKYEDHEFIGISGCGRKYCLDHVRYIYPMLGLTNYRHSKILKGLQEILIMIQKIANVNLIRRYKNEDVCFCDGWTWFSITDAFARYVLLKELWIEKTFKRSKAADEMFIQTIAYNSMYRKKINNAVDLMEGSKRLIDWNRGRPYTYRHADSDELIQSKYLFARKFDENIDNDIIEILCNTITKEDGLPTLVQTK